MILLKSSQLKLIHISFLLSLSIIGCIQPAGAAENNEFVPIGPQIHGTAINSYKYGHISGNPDYSFVDEGNNYTGEINLSYKQVFEEWAVEAEIDVRKTDDTEIEIRKAPHILSGYVRMHNDWLDFTVGDVQVDLSQYVMNRNLEGVYLETSLPALHTVFKTTIGSGNEPDEYVAYERMVYGQRLEHDLSGILGTDQFILGENIAYQSDRRGSIKFEENVPAVKNLVSSIDAQMKMLSEKLEINTEWATSHVRDSEQIEYEYEQSGTAFRVGSYLEFEGGNIGYDFERIGPEFYTDSGSATSDYYMHYPSVAVKISDAVQFSAAYRFFSDNVNNQLSTTTRNYVPTMTVNIKPFTKSSNNFLNHIAITTTTTHTLTQADDKTTDHYTQNYENRVTGHIDQLMLYTGFSAKHRTDRVGSSDSRGYSMPIGFSTNFTSDAYDFGPSLEYRIGYDDRLITEQIIRTHAINAGFDLTLYKKWNLSAYYNFEGLFKKDDKFSKSSGYDISLGYQLNDQLLLQAIYYVGMLNQNEDDAGGGTRDRTIEAKCEYHF